VYGFWLEEAIERRYPDAVLSRRSERRWCEIASIDESGSSLTRLVSAPKDHLFAEHFIDSIRRSLSGKETASERLLN